MEYKIISNNWIEKPHKYNRQKYNQYFFVKLFKILCSLYGVTPYYKVSKPSPVETLADTFAYSHKIVPSPITPSPLTLNFGINMHQVTLF